MVALLYVTLVVLGIVLFISEYYLIRDTLRLTKINDKCKKLAEKPTSVDLPAKS